MRMRYKPYARPELAAWEHYIDHPADYLSKWHMLFSNPDKPLQLELGCGKGKFLSERSLFFPEFNYLGIDIKSEMLVVAKRTIERVYLSKNKSIENIKITSHNIEQMRSILSPEDFVDRIYINFCNPWYKSGHAKHRLTHPRQLIQYREFLREDGEIWFKTDDMLLFKDSLRYFKMSGFEILYQTADLHAEDSKENIQTEHEVMFSSEGIPIMACKAIKRPADLDKEFFSRQKNI